MKKAKLETELTEEDKEALDRLVHLVKLSRTANDNLQQKVGELEYAKAVVDELNVLSIRAKDKITELGLLMNYRQRCYIEGLIRGV